MSNTIAYKSECFNWTRFSAYFRLYLVSYRKKLLLSALLMVALTFVLYLFIFLSNMRYEYQNILNDYLDPETRIYAMQYVKDYDPFWNEEMGVNIFLVFVFSAIAGSWMFSTLTGKKVKLGTIETPASQLEKFATWWLIYLPIFVVTVLCSFYCAELLRVGWAKMFSEYGRFVHLLPLKNLVTFCFPNIFEIEGQPGVISPSTALCLGIYSGILLTNSIYSLGGILFQRLNFLKTSGAMFALSIIYGFIFYAGLQTFTLDYYTEERFSVNAMFILLYSFVALVSFGLYWLGYARYKEEDIINRW